jgi:hypothetical protein
MIIVNWHHKLEICVLYAGAEMLSELMLLMVCTAAV